MRKRLLILPALLLSLLSGLPAATAASPATETDSRFQYSTDSDGVQSRSLKVTDENSGRPLTYTLYYTRIGQKFQSDINEHTFLFKWSRPLANQETALTFWGGYLKNDIRSFVPAAVMYDKGFSDTQHLWLSAGRETIGTIPANRLGLFRSSLSAAYQWKTSPGASLNLSGDQWFYSDQNREQKWQLSYDKQLSTRFTLAAMYQDHDAKFTRPGIYWVPQKDQAFILAPRYSLPIGQGIFSLTLQKALWARNADGSITRHDIGAAYQLGKMTAGYHYLRDGDYTSHNYTLDYQLFW